MIDYKVNPKLYQLLYYSLVFIPYFLPSILITLSCIICIFSIRKKTIITRERKNNTISCRNRATQTIILVTLLYIVLHVPHWAFLVMFLISNHGLASISYASQFIDYAFVLAAVLSVYINASLNPVLYLCRVDSIRAHVRSESARASIYIKDSVTSNPIFRRLSTLGSFSKSMRTNSVLKQNGLKRRATEQCVGSATQCETINEGPIDEAV